MMGFFNKDKKEKDKDKKDKDKVAQNPQRQKTIDAVVRDKHLERRKLEEDEKEFQRRRRERERNIIHIEKEELLQREEEVRKKTYQFEEVRRKHRSIEDTLEGKVKEYQMELEDKRLDHGSLEKHLEREIGAKTEVIEELRRSVTRRMEEFGETEPISISSSPRPMSTLNLSYPPTSSFSPSSPTAPPLDQVDQRSTETETLEGESVGGKKKEEPVLRRTMYTGSMSNISHASRGRGRSKGEDRDLARCKSLARGEEDLGPIMYPEVPTEDPGEQDPFMTIKRPAKKMPVLENVD